MSDTIGYHCRCFPLLRLVIATESRRVQRVWSQLTTQQLTSCLVQMDDIKQFRQWGSKTPGHPENFITEGVEVTTGAALLWTCAPLLDLTSHRGR